MYYLPPLPFVSRGVTSCKQNRLPHGFRYHNIPTFNWNTFTSNCQPKQLKYTKWFSGGSRICPRRGRQLPGGAPTYDFAKIFQKLHEIERIWIPRGARVPCAPLDPPLCHCVKNFVMISHKSYD